LRKKRVNAPNAQFNLAAADSLAMRIALKMRHHMFGMFMAEFQPAERETVLDVGVTSDQTYENSNYFEALYPYKNRIVAAGLQDAAFLEARYPGLHYLQSDALNLPFADRTFDLVHSSAVLEHVGSLDNQGRMIAECLRVARRGVCLTTPNRWFPIEFHTQLPLVHWLPKPACRRIFRWMGLDELAEEKNLNLMDGRELRALTASMTGWRFRVATTRLLGWKSNMLLFAHRI
jgi:ubiquinone/menaquinone biosynthesis C-methylase UbiE